MGVGDGWLGGWVGGTSGWGGWVGGGGGVAGGWDSTAPASPAPHSPLEGHTKKPVRCKLALTLLQASVATLREEILKRAAGHISAKVIGTCIIPNAANAPGSS